MNIQSLSVVVPNIKCMNDCKFCVSKMNSDKKFVNQMDDNLPFFDLYLKDYLKRLSFARDNGCNTIMLTGNSEPQQNRKFLTYFGMFMQMMDNPFRWIEMQTTGVMLDRNYLRFLRNHVGVNLISLSVSSFCDEVNSEIIGMNKTIARHFSLSKLCKDIKEYDFSLRLSINLWKWFENFNAENILNICKNTFGADQVTFRVLYDDNENTEQSKWIKNNLISEKWTKALKEYIETYGTYLGRLPYGQKKYSIYGMSVVIDDDCMAKERNDENIGNYKYLVLQPNCKLYSQWDDLGSLIF